MNSTMRKGQSDIITHQDSDTDLDKVVELLTQEVKKFKDPAVTEISKKTRDPFRILIGTMLSLRTKDTVTREASSSLFKLASTAEEMKELPLEEIEQVIYPVGFWRNKAKAIKKTTNDLVNNHDSQVPDNLQDLLVLSGVGRKTANFVLGHGFGKDAICVDTHVHRISNRLGWVTTKTTEETEFALMKKLPRKYWIIINNLLVTWGQNICTPISPKCSQCEINQFCPKVGVKKHR